MARTLGGILDSVRWTVSPAHTWLWMFPSHVAWRTAPSSSPWPRSHPLLGSFFSPSRRNSFGDRSVPSFPFSFPIEPDFLSGSKGNRFGFEREVEPEEVRLDVSKTFGDAHCATKRRMHGRRGDVQLLLAGADDEREVEEDAYDVFGGANVRFHVEGVTEARNLIGLEYRVYVVRLQCREHTWTIHKDLMQFLKLHWALKTICLEERVQKFGEKALRKAQGALQRVDEITGMELRTLLPESEREGGVQELPALKAETLKSVLRREDEEHFVIDCMKEILDPSYVVLPQVKDFLRVSRMSFAREYGERIEEGNIFVSTTNKRDACGPCTGVMAKFRKNWMRVWAVLKPGFLAFYASRSAAVPGNHPIEVVVFDALPSESIFQKRCAWIQDQYTILVTCGYKKILLRTKRARDTYNWAASINEIARQEIGWCSPSRHGSFAPPRSPSTGALCKWLVDAENAYAAIAKALEEASHQIFIAGWWVCPELCLRRPYAKRDTLRELLRERANSGVQVYVLMYKEVTLAMSLKSEYMKHLLDHENIHVVRHPDGNVTSAQLWSHHEKIVAIDNRVAFVGGLDLCFGRFDTSKHRLDDVDGEVWPGLDYYNPRVIEPTSWDRPMEDIFDRTQIPRMPWHDVHCAVWGLPALDVARHFVQCWNFAVHTVVAEAHQPFLVPWQTLPDLTVVESRHDPGELHAERLTPEQSPVDHRSTSEVNEKVANLFDIALGPARTDDRHRVYCQVLRSVGQWSIGCPRREESSIYKAYLSLIEESQNFIYIENQFFVSGEQGNSDVKNRILQVMRKRLMRAVEAKEKFKIFILIPLEPGFPGGILDSAGTTYRAIMHWQFQTLSRGGSSLVEGVKACGGNPEDYISVCGLRTYGYLSGNGKPTTSQVYVHSKVMIVDDTAAIIGSPNINDRSMLGERDSEIALLLEYGTSRQIRVNGQLHSISEFVHSLRIRLMSEHLGLLGRETDGLLEDPTSDTFFYDTWCKTAQYNEKLYLQAFSGIANSTIFTKAALKAQSPSEFPKPLPGASEHLQRIKGHLVSYPLAFMKYEDLRPSLVSSEYFVGSSLFT